MVQAECAGSAAGPEDWRVGDPCLATFALDGRWYRGEVRRVDRDRARVAVCFVDYGNTDWCDESEVRLYIRL